MEGKNLTNEIRFYPLLVSSSGLEQQSDIESEQVWKQLDSIPVNNKKILLSTSIIENLYCAEQKFQWEPYYSVRLSYFIRELFFQNISQSEFYKAVEALFTKQYQSRFNEILSYINNTILTSQPDPEEIDEVEPGEADISQENAKQYTLLDALAKFSNLTNQVITTERIKLKSSAEPARPTLSNWLKNYRDELGLGVHDAVARAKFLFESPNTKRLPSIERDRIHALVRSLEDNELLTIDTKKQEIVFQNETKQEKASDSNRTLNNQEPPSPDIFDRFQNISEPVRHQEELKNVGTQTFAGGKINSELKNNDEQALLTRIKNMFVAPQKANEPAPKEDFREFAPVPPSPLKEPEPMGTIRFSAKHVLPAERQISKEQVKSQYEPPKFVSQLVQNQKTASLPTPPLAQSLEPPSVAPVPVTQTVLTEKEYQPASMFRIKPNRD